MSLDISNEKLWEQKDPYAPLFTWLVVLGVVIMACFGIETYMEAQYIQCVPVSNDLYQ
jgi:hypothetical protein